MTYKYSVNLFVLALSFVIPGSFFVLSARELYFGKSNPLWIWVFVVVLAVAWILWLVYLFNLRVELTPEHIKYRNLLGGSHQMLRTEISSVIMEKREGSETTTYMLIVTPRFGTGKLPLKIPLSLLNLRAAVELPATLNAKERDSRDLLTLT
jgi:hypothetical protein